MNIFSSAVLYRLVAELACIVGVICATVLAYADKSPWIWSWFLIFAALNIVGGLLKVSETETTKDTARPAISDS